MKIFGFAALQSFVSLAANTFASSPQSLQPVFNSYLERQSYHPLSSPYNASENLRYQPRDKISAHISGRSVARQRRAALPQQNARDSAIQGDDSILEIKSTPVAPAPENKIYDRAQNLFAQTYAKIHNCSLKQAQTTLQEADQTLYQSWRNLKNIDELIWIPAADDQPRTPYDLAHAAATFSTKLLKYPDTNDASARSFAEHYLTLSATTIIENDIRSDLYQGVLQRGLHWIDLNNARTENLSATQILQTVCRHRHPDIQSRTALTERLNHYRDVIIDEAALIAFYAQSRQHAVTPSAPIHTLRAQYASALIDEWQDAAIGLGLLPSAPLMPAHATFWYDGAIMHNVRGKSMEQIVNALYQVAPYTEEKPDMQRLIDNASRPRHLIGQPEYLITKQQRETLIYTMHGDVSTIDRYPQRTGAINIAGVWLTHDELYSIVEKTMRNLMLDTVYPAGTPLNAIATIVRRLGPLHGVVFDTFNNSAALMEAFNRLKRNWHNLPHFVISPSLCAAFHLALTSDVLFIDANSSLIPYQQILHQMAHAIIPALEKIGIDSSSAIPQWTHQLDSLLDQKFAVRNTPRILQGFAELSIPIGIHAYIKRRQLAPETISYNGTADLNHQLHEYLQQRLLAQAPAPRYNESFLITQILRHKLFMTEVDLHKSTTMTITSLGRSAQISVLPLTEFTKRSNSLTTKMTFSGKTINTAEELRTAKTQAADALFNHPIILAKSKEIVRQTAVLSKATDIDSIRNILVKDVMNTTETFELENAIHFFHRLFGSATIETIINTLASGEPKQILGLFPFVIPMYDIEEGLRLGDRQRALDGVLHFGADAILTALGAGAESILRRQLAQDVETMLLARTRMSPAERAGIDTIGNMAMLMPEISPERLAQRRTVIEEDTFTVHAATSAPSAQTLPKTLEAAAWAGNRLDEHSFRILFLDDEQRSVAATPSREGFSETDFRGNAIVDAPPIFRDPASGSYYRLTEDFSRPGGAAGISSAELTGRETVSNIHSYWQTIMTVPEIRIRSPAPADLINTLFKSSTHLLYTEFEQFWIMAYERSETAAAIINNAYYNLESGRSACEIEFGADAARTNNNHIWFMDKEALSTLRYTAPGGTVSFQRKRMWVHESIHHLTGLKDPPQHKAHNNRGATIYMTDRILSELGTYPPLQPRTTYELPPAFGTGENHGVVFEKWRNSLRKINEITIAENMRLDKILDVHRNFPSSMYVMGQKIADRATVQQGLELIAHIKSLGTLGDGNAERIFSMISGSFTSSIQFPHKALLRTLISKSKTFRTLAAAWNTTPKHDLINIVLKNFDHALRFFDSRSCDAHIVASDGSKVWLNSQPLYYFSEFDTTPLGATRRYVGALIDLFISEMIPKTTHLQLQDHFLERGLRVLLENKVLQQIGNISPQRICAALSSDRNSYLRDQTTATRATVSEDGYLYRTANSPSLNKGIPQEAMPDAEVDDQVCSFLSCIG